MSRQSGPFSRRVRGRMNMPERGVSAGAQRGDNPADDCKHADY
jgi:hypothetical protein